MERPLNFLSLFSGIGGLDLGLERAGMRCVGQVEIDPYCRRVLEKHWPDVPKFEDVRTVTRADFTEDIDLIAGGFPCQDISTAGRGEGIEGPRSGLWMQFFRLIREIRPDFVVVENVAALLTRGIGRVLGDLASIRFDAEWFLLPASAVGARHFRCRLFIVGTRADADASGIGLEKRRSAPRFRPMGLDEGSGWETEPDVGRVAHGIPARVDRLRGLGNAVVPQVAEWIGRRIVEAASAPTSSGESLGS